MNKLWKTIPGPGTYDIRTTKKVPGGGITFISRRVNTADEIESPGPGAYDPKLLGNWNLPSYKLKNNYCHELWLVIFNRIGTATRQLVDRENIFKPGPGHYEPKFSKTAPAYRLFLG